MSEPIATHPHVDSKLALSDWAKIVAIVLVIGPPIGGVIFGLYASIALAFRSPGEWTSFPIAIFASMAASYIVGLPIAIVGVLLFLLLNRFFVRGTAFLAVLCGVISSQLLVFLNDVTRQSTAIKFVWVDYVVMLGMLGIPAAISALACWRITRPMHRLR